MPHAGIPTYDVSGTVSEPAVWETMAIGLGVIGGRRAARDRRPE